MTPAKYVISEVISKVSQIALICQIDRPKKLNFNLLFIRRMLNSLELLSRVELL
jgi:hypothetical protein